MRENIRKYKKTYFPAVWIYSGSFLLGILIPNIIWKTAWNQKAAASIYLLSIFAGKDLEDQKYFIQVLKMRASIFILDALCGITVFGVVIAIVGLLGSGLLLGMVLTMSVLEFGIPGCAVGIGLVFPQYIFYIPCMLLLFTEIYRQSLETWKNQGRMSADITGYTGRILLCGLGYSLGILLEIYCNPRVMEFLMKNISIF